MAGAPSDHGLRHAIGALVAALTECGAPFMIIGGIAVILRGVARQTNDVDATIWAGGLDVDQVFVRLGLHGISGRIPDAAGFARAHQVLLLRHDETDTPMELSLAWLPFEQAALRRAERIEIDGVVIPVAEVGDLIVYKFVAWRARDRVDIERLLRIHADRLDLGSIRATLADFAHLLDEPDRLQEFDRLVERIAHS